MQLVLSKLKYWLILKEKFYHSLGRAYTKCDELPLYNFIEVVTTGNLDKLVIRGRVRDLEQVWEGIHDEYTTLTKDTTVSATFRLTKEIHILNNKLITLDRLVNYLRSRYVPGVFPELRSMGFKYQYTKDSIQFDLDKIVTQSKSMILRLKQAQDELKALSGKESATKQDYYDMLAILGKFKGADINPRNYTVMQFISDSNLYKKSNGQ